MKVKNITAKEQKVVNVVKAASPWKDSEVNIYEWKSTRFIHEINGDEQVLSISRFGKPVTEKELIFAIKKIMKMQLEDVQFRVRPSGVVFIEEKDDSLPKIANCYH